MPSGPTRRSRRTRGEVPEIVPPKSDEEPEVDEDGDYTDPKTGSVIALGAIRGRRSKRTAAAGSGGGGGRKQKTKDTARATAPKRRTRRTRGAAQEEEEKPESGDSSQNPSESESSSDDENDGDDTGVSGEDNAAAGEDKAGDESEGKDDDKVSDEEEDSEDNAVQKRPKRSGRRSKKAPATTSAPKRRARPRRGAAKAKADENSAEDDQATSSLQSDGDSSTKVDEKPNRRGTRKRKLPDRTAPKRGAKTKAATASEEDDDKPDESSDDDDGSKQSSDQKNKDSASASADGEPPASRKTNDSKKSTKDADSQAKAKNEETAQETPDEEKVKENASIQSSQGSDSEKAPDDQFKSSTAESRKSQADGDETSSSRRRRKRARAASPPKDIALKDPLSPVQEAPEEKSKSDVEEDKPASESLENDEKSSKEEPDDQEDDIGEDASSKSKQDNSEEKAMDVVGKDEQNVTNEDGQQQNEDRGESLVEKATSMTNGEKRKLSESDETKLDDAGDKDSGEQPRKRAKHEVDETKSVSPRNDESESADLKDSIPIEAQETKPVQDVQQPHVPPKVNDDDVHLSDTVEKPVETSTEPTETDQQQSKTLTPDAFDDDKSEEMELSEKSPHETNEVEKEDPRPDPELAKDVDSPEDSAEMPSSKLQSEAALEPPHGAVAEEKETTETPKESDAGTNDSKEAEGSAVEETQVSDSVEDKSSALMPHTEDKDVTKSPDLKEAPSDSSLTNEKAEPENETRAVDTNDTAKEDTLDPEGQDPSIAGSKVEVSENKEQAEAESSDKVDEAKEITEKPTESAASNQNGTENNESSNTESSEAVANSTNEAAVSTDTVTDDLSKRASSKPPTASESEPQDKEATIEGENEMAIDDEKDSEDEKSQPLEMKSDTSSKLQPVGMELDSTEAPLPLAADEKESKTEDGSDLKDKEMTVAIADTQKEPAIFQKPEAVENDRKDVSVLDKNDADVSAPMDVEDGSDHPKKLSESDGVLPETTTEPLVPTEEKSFDAVDSEAVKDPHISPTIDTSQVATDRDSEAGFIRTVTEEVEPPPPEPVKTVVWKTLSNTKRVATSKAPDLYGLNESKINRVKMVLYTLGSKVHRGKGFERLFADYWDAVCLRLSNRLSSHTSAQCDQSIATFLISKKLRKVHNQFIMGIMRRSTRVFVRPSEISSHIPVKWRDRVKVRVIQTTPAPKARQEKLPMTMLEKEFLRIGDLPHPVSGQPYKEPWQVFDEVVDNSEIGLEQSAAVESNSQCIPGAMVVDPVLRSAAEAKGLQSSDNAMWLLTIAVREHTKNVLKGSIAHKKALEKGEVHPKFLHYPNILASNSKNGGKHRIDTSVPPKQEGDKKTRISALDVFSASRGMPAGQIGSLGGAISRLSLEQSLQSAFQSIPPFFPGKDFKDVQNYVSTEIFDIAQAQEQAAAKKRAENSSTSGTGTPHNTESKSNVASSSKAGHSQAPPASSEQKSSSDPKQQAGNAPSAVAETSHEKAPDQKAATPATGPVDNPSENSEASKVAEQSGQQPQQQQPQQRPSAGAGRGAKNLRALMARASSDANKEDEGATTATTSAAEGQYEAKKDEPKGESESKNPPESAKPESGETVPANKEETTPPKTEDDANPENPTTTEDSLADDAKPSAPSEEMKTDTAKPPPATSPETQEEKTPVESKESAKTEPANNTESTDGTEAAAADKPKGKAFGSKDLSEQATDEKKEGSKEGEEKESNS